MTWGSRPSNRLVKISGPRLSLRNNDPEDQVEPDTRDTPRDGGDQEHEPEPEGADPKEFAQAPGDASNQSVSS